MQLRSVNTAGARDVSLRRLEPPDAGAYRAFRLRGLRDHPEAFTSSFEEESQRPASELSARLVITSPTHLWGAFTAPAAAGTPGELIGVFGFSREVRLKNRHKATLIGMMVAPEFAGLGVGRALVDAVMQDARDSGVSLLVLTVTEGNARARALYAQAGFRSIGIEPDAIRVDGASHGKEHMVFQITPARADSDVGPPE
jgi:RimJ/RimL family protein N-acetyltransferase